MLIRVLVTILAAMSMPVGAWAVALQGSSGAQQKPGDQVKEPSLSDVSIVSAKTQPVLIKFSIKLVPAQGKTPFGKKSGLWFCFGKPTTLPSLRAELEKELKEDGDRFFLNMRGPGFVAAQCSDLKEDANKPGTWTGTIDLGEAEIRDGQIEIPSAFGSTSYKLTEMPISWVYFDDERHLSNEFKAIVDLKAGKVVKVVEEPKKR